MGVQKQRVLLACGPNSDCRTPNPLWSQPSPSVQKYVKEEKQPAKAKGTGAAQPEEEEEEGNAGDKGPRSKRGRDASDVAGPSSSEKGKRGKKQQQEEVEEDPDAGAAPDDDDDDDEDFVGGECEPAVPCLGKQGFV